jgi:hypothetical protein
MYYMNNISEELPTSQPIVWETYEERDGMTVIERHTLINGVEVIDRVF